MKTPENQFNQEIPTPSGISETGDVVGSEELNVEQSPISIRTHKNNERGTEMTYATVALGDFDLQSPRFENEVKKLLDKIYGENEVTYKLGDERADKNFYDSVNNFIKDPNEQEIVVRLHEKAKQHPTINYERLYPEHFLTLRKIGKRLVITQTPVIHTITGGIALRGQELSMQADGFEDLLNILKSGFKVNVEDKYGTGSGNTILKSGKHNRITRIGGQLGKKGVTEGDKYNLEIFPSSEKNYVADWASDPQSSIVSGENEVEYFVKEASVKNISAINIQLSEDANSEQIEQKRKYYKEQITEKYGVPVKFHYMPR